MEQESTFTFTSSRFHQTLALSANANAQEKAITAQTIAHCHVALEHSRFFGLLKVGQVTPAAMQYVFLQYGHWRDRLHQWFGLCIVKAESCREPSQEAAILSLADHIFTDLQDGHNAMYIDFLHELGLSDDEIVSSQRSTATLAYERSFVDAFGYGMDNFYDALAALSGRELCVSIRNRFILQFYFDARAMKHPTWLSLHAELEVDHFQNAIHPVLSCYEEDPGVLTRVMAAVNAGIDRHVQYFEDLFQEYESQHC